MDIAMLGLGRMGGNMARRLLESGHRVVGWNRSPEVTRELAAEAGLTPAMSFKEVVELLPAPRPIWIMLPAGHITDEAIEQLMDLLSEGDIIIDGGNTYYKDDIRRAAMLSEKGIKYVDCGTSGGIWGLKEGYSMMIGGETEAVTFLTPIFETLAPGPDKGWGHVGPGGAGHFVKMVHNGIEYGMMQAYAEGFEILRTKREFGLDLAQIAHVWQYGSVVRSWLLDLAADALDKDAELSSIAAWVDDSGEGRWTVSESIDLDVPAPVITASLQARFVSRHQDNYAAKMLAAMRNEFGGHAIKKADK
jgi:6-phosphogluconate dehydrogenase